MALSRTLRRRIASIVALALLFMQLAVTAHACPVRSAAAPDTSMAGMPCEQTMAGQAASDGDQPALCFAHCQADAAQPQPDLTPPVVSFAATPALPITLAPASSACDARAWRAHERERGRAPPAPHSIAHCCWRI
jgi:hypothetical protein